MASTTERTFRDERDAHDAQRALIAEGRTTSLVAYDGNRNLYVFDVYDVPGAPQTPDAVPHLRMTITAEGVRRIAQATGEAPEEIRAEAVRQGFTLETPPESDRGSISTMLALFVGVLAILAASVLVPMLPARAGTVTHAAPAAHVRHIRPCAQDGRAERLPCHWDALRYGGTRADSFDVYSRGGRRLTLVYADGHREYARKGWYADHGDYSCFMLCTIRPCAYEDGSGQPLPCRWDAGTEGNGRGESFTVFSRGGHKVTYVYDDGHREYGTV